MKTKGFGLIKEPTKETPKLPKGKFSTIVIDPPWPYSPGSGPVGTGGRGKKGRYATQVGIGDHYNSMTMEELLKLPVGKKADTNAHLYLWITNSFVEEGCLLIKEWGFVYKTMLTWGKIDEHRKPSMKTGYYFRGATEHCLFAVKGKLRTTQKPPRATLQLSGRLPHSVKPPWFYKLVEEQSPGPYLEMFARRKRAGWTVWGNEV